MHAALELNTLLERRLFHISLTMFKIHRGIVTAPLLVDLFVNLEDTHGRHTRAVGRKDLVISSRIWKLLPPDLRNLNTVDTFTKHYWALKV